MAIDYMIEFDCAPKRELGRGGILERLKERQRAREVIEWFRAAGDERPPAEMGFEFSQSTPGDSGAKQLIVVQDLLDHAAALDAYAGHCVSCPANRTGDPYGCTGFIQYPITALAETWLLDQLPAQRRTARLAAFAARHSEAGLRWVVCQGAARQRRRTRR